ncbi:unnamed protein product [Sphagnum jensenii]|uniref:Embryonic stem cell-specific 5-hydroxymethylcytosine-binding protein n=1 Tax=Sphagnum jensenii TaxID=128206 RepID=A0ABP1ABF1_9BRYO
MCGRARCTLRVDAVASACGFQAPLRSINSDRYHPSYNVAPGAHMPVVHYDSKDKASKEPVVHCMRWGLVPSFTKKSEKPDYYRMFNARSESVHVKSSFCRLLQKNRCLVAVEGFYEWKKDGKKKQPFYVHFKDKQPLVFAALYDSWEDAEGEVLYTFTILTTRVSKQLEWLHDRMPVVLGSQDLIHAWLNDDLSESALHKLTQPYEGSDMVWYPVTPAMGRPAFNGPECVEEIKPKAAIDGALAQLFGKQKARDVETLAIGSSLKDEEILNEEEQKALLAGVEPDHDRSKVSQGEEVSELDLPQPQKTEVKNESYQHNQEGGGLGSSQDNSKQISTPQGPSEQEGSDGVPGVAQNEGLLPIDEKVGRSSALELPQVNPDILTRPTKPMSRKVAVEVKDAKKRRTIGTSKGSTTNNNAPTGGAKEKQSNLFSFFAKQ